MTNNSSDQQRAHSEHEHREAVIGLRAALGTILSPKRPPLPHSHSHSSTPSGTASPYHFNPHQTHPHPGTAGSRTDTPPVIGVPPPSPATKGSGQHGHHQAPPHSQAHLPTHPNAQTHYPSRLSMSRTPSTSPSHSEGPSPPSSPGPDTPPVLHASSHAPDVHLHPHHHHHYHQHQHHQSPLVPVEEISASPISPAEKSGAVTPNSKAKFLTTLQGKSAWDAMVHGSWM